MKKRAISLALAVIMALGLAVPSFAAGPTFTDVPETYWGYENIEAAAANGYMNGVGGGLFSPETKVTVAQFLTLLGRLVFPDVKTEGSDWYGPYVAKAQETGMLTGSQVDVNNVTAEITRYDMAVILRAAAKNLGVAEKTAQQSQVTDYLDIPTRYAEAVLAVYGMGLIKGDEKNNFNGANTMKRAEVATVIMRLAKAIPGGNTNPGKPTTEPGKEEQPTEQKENWLEAYVPIPTYDPDSVEVIQGERIRIDKGFLDPTLKITDRVHLLSGESLQLAICEVPMGYGYDGSEATWTSEDESIATVDETGLITALKRGCAVIRVTIPVHYYNNEWTTSMDMLAVYVDP